MTQGISHLGTSAVRIDGNDEMVTTVKNVSGEKIYYKSTEGVSSSSSDGNIAEGESVAIVRPTYFVSVGSSKYSVSQKAFNNSGITKWPTFTANAAEATGTDETAASEVVYIAECNILADCTLTGVEVCLGTIAAEVEGKYLKVALYNSGGSPVAYNSTEGTTIKTANSKTYFAVPFTAQYRATTGKYFVGITVKETKTKLRVVPKVSMQVNCSKKEEVAFATFHEKSITPPTTFTEKLAPICNTY